MKNNAAVSNRISRLLIILGVMAGFVFTGVTPKALGQTTSVSGFTYNGIVYTSWWYDEYGNYEDPPIATGAATTSMDQLAAEGGNYVSVLVTQYVATGTSTTIAPSATQTPLDDQLVFAIQGYHNMGMKVFLKPHVDSLDGTWRGAFEPSDPAAWFASFQTFIVHYATLAQENQVEGLVFGTEYKTLSGSAYESNWATIIAAIRAVYTGQLAYGANAVAAGDEFTSVSFWPLVDIIGVDAYVPLTDLLDPTVPQLVAAWTDTSSPFSTGFNAVAAYQLLNTTYGKPVIMTEIGYDSVAGSNIEPYANYSTTYDGTEQEDCYEAVFEVFSQQTSWFKGIFFWNWTIPALAADDLYDDPNGKPAGTITLTKWFASALPGIKISNSNPSITMAQTSTATSTITSQYTGGYTGSITLAASGLPAGVTASFATNPTTTTSVLTLTASATAAAGTAKVTITGTSGSYTSTTIISVTILTSACNIVYTISPESSTGFGAALTIDNTGTNPLTSWTLTWSFANGQTVSSIYGDTTETQSGANVTVTNASYNGALAATTGSTSLGFQGVWNGVTNAIPTNFAINGTACTVNGSGVTQGFSLASSPTALSVAQGGTGADTITVTDTGGFTGSVTLAATGLPTGVTVAYGTNPTSATSVLTFTATAAATVGTSTVTITGTSGTLTATTTIALTVTTAGSFTIKPSATTLSVAQGATGTDTITVTDVSPFAGSVTLSAAGLPTGVT
ncbi:MAG: cellulose binding domain-containing protein, partial [Terracidiphilus sp.]